jgi:transcriptional regulator with XRE-family HTH domain
MRAVLPSLRYAQALSSPQITALRPVSDLPDFDLKAFGKRLRTRREQRGYTQTELSERSGLAQMSISTWERGKTTPNVVNLMKLARALGLRPETLIDPTIIEIESIPKSAAEQVWRHARAIIQIVRKHRQRGRDVARRLPTDRTGVDGAGTAGRNTRAVRE